MCEPQEWSPGDNLCLQPFFVFIVAAKLLYTVSKCSRAEQVNNSRLFRMRDTSLPFSPCLSLFCFILRTYCIYSTVTPRSHSSARGLSLSSCLSLLSPVCHCQLHLSLCLLEFLSVLNHRLCSLLNYSHTITVCHLQLHLLFFSLYIYVYLLSFQ